MEKVSICIPVYNGEKTIRETVVSALNQTYSDIEVIVTDNCSTDGTVEILNDLEDDRLIIHENEENIGMLGNWNMCVKLATGKFVHILCADDVMKSDCIEKKMKMFNDENVNFVFSASDVIDESGKVLMTRSFGKTAFVEDGGKLVKKSLHRRNIFGEPSNVLFKKSIWEEIGGPALNLYNTADWEMWLRMAARGKVGYVPDTVIQYRVSSTNETSKLKLKRFFLDDRLMIENLKEDSAVNINGCDIIIHKVMYVARLFARLLYTKLFVK